MEATEVQTLKQVWIQLAQLGAFRGHPQGAFKIDPEAIESMVRNFKRDGLPIPIDAEHASEMKATEGSIPSQGAPAMGWIHELENRGANGLWGKVEWLEPARGYIKEGRYKFISPAIRWKSKDRVTGAETGPRLSSAAITNQPFLPDMQAVTARNESGEPVYALTSIGLTEEGPTQLSFGCCYSADEFLPRIKSALRLHDLATPTQMAEMMANLREHMEAADGDHTRMVNGVRLQDYALPLRSIVNAHAGMSWDEVFDVVEDLIDVAMDKHIIEDHGGVEESDDPALNSSAEATVAASTLTAQGGPAMAATNTKTAEQYEVEITSLTGERQTLLEQIDALKAQVTTLSAKVEEHETQVLSARVDEAFESYKDSRKLPPNGKASMLSYLRTDPSGFEVLFPKLQAPQRHLMNVLTADGRNAHSPTQLRVQADSPSNLTEIKPQQMVREIMRKTGCTLAKAQCQVDAMLTQMKRSQQV